LEAPAPQRKGGGPIAGLSRRRNALLRAARAGLVLACLFAGEAAAAQPAPSGLQALVQGIRETHRIPAIAVMVQEHGAIESAVVGVRAAGHAEPATLDDQWHIGSDTKAFTATLMARLAEKGVLALDDTLERALPSLASSMHPAYRKVTLAQLLTHTAGFPALVDPGELPEFRRVIASGDNVVSQRAAVARHYLSQPPASPAGTFAYSNLDYTVAGAIAEARTGLAWEELMQREVFAPLGIQHAGFGPPGTPGRFDEPHGHELSGGTLVPLDPADPDADNPPALGPAGTLHITLGDWMRFAQEHLAGMHGRGTLLSPAMYRRVHTPVAGYALGWGALMGPRGEPVVVAHTGSNGNWLADIRIDARNDSIVLIAMNAASPEAHLALDELKKQLVKRTGAH
jgi:CubicO group peptidase (beta-lactamase class C family)